VSAARWLVLACAALGAPEAIATAQGAARCTIDSSAAWFRRQRAWGGADEVKHDWSNDSLRTALLTATVAILEDRLRTRAGRRQLYGTQLVRGEQSTLEPAPIEDPKHVDLRRDAAGLPPLAVSLCLARAGVPGR
jgi:hypothetical protein